MGNLTLAEDRANNILNKVFSYDEGIMSRKEWLELMFKKGYELKGNELHDDKTSIELNITEVNYFKRLEEFYCKNIDNLYLVDCFDTFRKKLELLVIDIEEGTTTLDITIGNLLDMIKAEVLGHKLID